MKNVLFDKTSHEKRLIGQNVLRKTSYWTERPTKNVLLDKTSYEKRLIGHNVPQMKSPQTYMQYIRSYGNNALQAKGPIYRQNVLYLL